MKLTIYRDLFWGFLCMIGSISFNACDKDEPSLVAATFISIVSDVQQTPRLVNTFWSPGDAVGISGTSAGVVYANVKYVTTGTDGRFTVAEAGKDIYYQSDEQVNFTAYYPFTGTGGGAAGVITYEITATDQTTDAQPSIDYLYGTGVGSVENPEVKLHFDHCMSRVVLNFQAGSGFDALPEKVECTVGGLVMHGSFDTSTGKAYVAEGESGKSITLDVASTTVGTRLLTLILFPQSTPSASVVVKVGEVTFHSTLEFRKGNGNPEVGLHPGRSYVFNVIVNKTGLSISEANVSDWLPGNGDGDDVDANM